MDRPPTLPQPGWHPDPFARHEYRYWDGGAWTDQVSDRGAVSSDPPVAAGGAGAYGGGYGPGTGAPPPRASRTGLWVTLGVFAAVAVVAAVVVVLTAGGGDGGADCRDAGRYDLEIERGEFMAVCVEVAAGEAMRFRVEPDDDLDAIVAIEFEYEFISDPFFTDSDLYASDPFTDGFSNFFTAGLEDATGQEDVGPVGESPIDSGGDGDVESDLFPPFPIDTTVTLLVAGYDGAAGAVELEIETLPAPDEFDPEDYPTLDEYQSDFYSDELFSDYYSDFFTGDFFTD
jgi:hypothetical protein